MENKRFEHSLWNWSIDSPFSIDTIMNKHNEDTVFKPFKGNTFCFSCHKDIPCFTECCAKLHLTLTPYDILRIKNRLEISSNDFLDKFTDVTIENNRRFPMIKLKMNEDEKQVCPFVSREGCLIYDDRPGACRLYPLGRASTMIHGEKNAREKFFIINEAHCMGLQEKDSWLLNDWLNHEGIN